MPLPRGFTDLLKQTLSLILLAATFSGAFSAAAQTRRPTRKTPGKSQTSPQTAKVPVVKDGETCRGGWSGVISYERTLDESGFKDDGGGSFRRWLRIIFRTKPK